MSKQSKMKREEKKRRRNRSPVAAARKRRRAEAKPWRKQRWLWAGGIIALVLIGWCHKWILP